MILKRIKMAQKKGKAIAKTKKKKQSTGLPPNKVLDETLPEATYSKAGTARVVKRPTPSRPTPSHEVTVSSKRQSSPPWPTKKNIPPPTVPPDLPAKDFSVDYPSEFSTFPTSQPIQSTAAVHNTLTMAEDTRAQEDAHFAGKLAPVSHFSVKNTEDQVTAPSDIDFFPRIVAPKAEMETIDEADLQDAESPGRMVQSPSEVLASPGQHVGSSRDKDLDVAGPGKDEMDAVASLSLYSYYMESDFRYYFQHPHVRLFIAYFVTFCNFLIYAEDPVAHSMMECKVPVIGNNFAFVFTRYAPNAWSLLKVIMWFTGIIVGMIIGKMLVHTLLFNTLFRLKMFSDDKGSWMTMFLCTIVSVFIFSLVYNAVLMIGGDATTQYRITSFMAITHKTFMKAAATGTWCGDFFTAWMVTDMMLQEKLYPMWAMRPRLWWNKGYNRIVLFWAVVLVSSFVVVFVIATDYISWDKLNRDFLHTNELSRAFLASFILVMDIIIVMQDWDFPHFVGAIDVKLPGINMAHIHFDIPSLLKRLEYWHIHISGKWFNYGILFIVIMLDLNMWKNQIFYSPYTYSQYIDSEHRIHSVTDDFSLLNANSSTLTFAYRNSTKDPITGKMYIELDVVMNARYHGYPFALKSLAFIPSISIFITFGVFVWLYGRLPKPTKDDPYGGRLKMRKKRRFSVRVGFKRLRKRFHSSPAVMAALKTLREEEEETGVRAEDKETAVAEKVMDEWKIQADEETPLTHISDGKVGHSDEVDANLDAKKELNMSVADV